MQANDWINEWTNVCVYMRHKCKQTKKNDERKDENKIFIQFKIRDYNSMVFIRNQCL